MSNKTFSDKRLTDATMRAYQALHKGTNGNPREIASCVATLFVDTMRMIGVPDHDALAALKATYEAIGKRVNQ